VVLVDVLDSGNSLNEREILMLVTRQEIVNEVLSKLGTTSGNIDATDLTTIRLRVNQVQDYIFYDRDWEWRKRTYYFTTRKPYSTGTVDVTENSKTVTGNGTTFTDAMRVGYLVLGDRAFKIQSVTSGTELKLESPYSQDSATLQTYKLVFPEIHLPHEIDSVVSVKLNGADLDVVDRDQLVLSVSSVATPQQASFGDRTREPYYDTNTVTVTNASRTVTGSSTSFEALMEGMSFRVDDFSKAYVIKSVDSPTQITLRDKYEGTGASGKSYSISPVGTGMLSFRYAPDDYYTVEVEALIGSDKLVSDNAYSLIPNHAPLLHGACWLALADFKNMNPVVVQQQRADFDRTLNQLRSSYSSVANLSWKSHRSIVAQKNRTSMFNPLDDRMF
jgi:hypothetical protein